MFNCYFYWDKGIDNMPLMIKYIYEHNVSISLNYNFNLVLLTDENIKQYIDIPDRYYNLESNFKSDIIRYFILDKFGGIWLDTDIIIIKNLNELYSTFIESDYMVMVDVEYTNCIGCASLFMKKNTICSKYCVDYINNYLNSNKPLKWVSIGPTTILLLNNKYNKYIKINNYDIVKRGCNFICWNDNPGINKDKWIMNKDDAQNKACALFWDNNCYYIITWTIYRQNNITTNIIDFVFKNEMSVFYYLINYSKNRKSTFNVLIATSGRSLLQNMLNSLIDQLNKNDCLTIVYDGHNSIPEFNISQFKCKVLQYYEPVQLGFWGHGIRNKYASLLEEKDFIMHADDDDIYYENTFNYLRGTCIDLNTLYICKIKWGGNNIIPVGNIIKCGNMATPCGIIPHNLNNKGIWAHSYGGDGCYYEELSVYAKNIIFLDKVIYLVRPDNINLNKTKPINLNKTKPINLNKTKQINLNKTKPINLNKTKQINLNKTN